MPIIPYADRVKMLEACKYVDEIYYNAPAWNITQAVLNDCGADYSLHSVENPDDYVNELTRAGHGELVANNKVHFLSYTNYHSTDIINTIKERLKSQ